MMVLQCRNTWEEIIGAIVVHLYVCMYVDKFYFIRLTVPFTILVDVLAKPSKTTHSQERTF